MGVMTGRKLLGNALARQPIDERLRIEQIEMARAAFHEQEDDAFGPGGEMLRFGGQRIGGQRGWSAKSGLSRSR